MKKQILCSLCVLPFSLNADDISPLDARISVLESATYNAPGRLQVSGGADLFIYGELLYLCAREENLNLAVVQKNPNVSRFRLLNDASIDSLQGEWNFGFRTGIGYNSRHDSWDLKFTYFHFNTKAHSVIGLQKQEAIYPTPVMPADTIFQESNQYASALNAQWHIHLNQLDLDLGKEFWTSRFLTLSPHIGLRTTWIQQSVRSFYELLAVFPASDNTITLKDHSWGLGLSAGLNTKWGFGGGWKLFGDLSAAILYGFHSITDVHVDSLQSDPTHTTQFVNLKDNFRLGLPVLDLAMGIEWERLLFHKRSYLDVRLGWEQHVYFHQNQFPLFAEYTTSGVYADNDGALTLQGWFLSARIGF
jgi:hypothetical protein